MGRNLKKALQTFLNIVFWDGSLAKLNRDISCNTQFGIFDIKINHVQLSKNSNNIHEKCSSEEKNQIKVPVRKK
jgi:hypothetical protein